jgi:hypothetical protein
VIRSSTSGASVVSIVAYSVGVPFVADCIRWFSSGEGLDGDVRVVGQPRPQHRDATSTGIGSSSVARNRQGLGIVTAGLALLLQG